MRFLILPFILMLLGCSEEAKIKTVCNPIDISYRFMPETPSRREAADPTAVLYKDTYYLFASKSGGYWYSEDLAEWNFVETREIPTEEYAPTAIVIEDTLFFLASSKTKSTIYKTTDPKSGHWEVAKDSLEIPVWDPGLFLDSDNKLYLYWGCSNVDPLYGVELDRSDFSFIGETKELLFPNPEIFGWEVRGDYNDDFSQSPWLEGAWVNKHDGKYYLQYAAPGTREKSYADGVYVSDNPLGPYEVAEHNAFAYKPEGYACGAGHGSTFEDKFGNFWHVGTVAISDKHKFERRLAFYPVFFDRDGLIYATTKLGDYPIEIPDRKIESYDDIAPNWMLLSYNKSVEVSSTLGEYSSKRMTDENIRTYWVAESGSDSEWAVIDLEKSCDIYGLQINFSEYKTEIYDRTPNIYHRYVVEGSNDKKSWSVVLDRSNNSSDNSHDYTQLESKVRYRYLKVSNVQVPDGNFALSGFRVFGNGLGDKPASVNSLTVARDINDRRRVDLTWKASEDAVGYNIKYGIKADKLYHNHTVYGVNNLTIRSLSKLQEYHFTVEPFNENGVVVGECEVVSVK